MLCTKCGKKEATVYYKQNINGKITEYNLCNDCAAEIRKQYNNTVGENLGSFFNDGFGEMNLLGSLFGIRPTERLAPAKTCPFCGATYRDFAESGKAGCAKCYDVFRSALSDTIVGIHGHREHTGRVPKKLLPHMSREKKIEKLKDKLSIAVGKQEFEEAAKLRDEIKKLEDESAGEAG